MYRKEEDYFCILIIIAILAPIIIVSMSVIPYRIESDNTIECEGTITQKKVDKGFGTAYIFVINGTTDIIVRKSVYSDFNVGDYVVIYESGRVVLING